MLLDDFPDLRKLLVLPHFGVSDRLRSEAIFVVGALRCDSSQNRRKQTDIGISCRSKPCKAKALREITAPRGQKWGAVRAPPKQCADNTNFRKRPDMVPSSLSCPRRIPPFSPKMPFLDFALDTPISYRRTVE